MRSRYHPGDCGTARIGDIVKVHPTFLNLLYDYEAEMIGLILTDPDDKGIVDVKWTLADKTIIIREESLVTLEKL